MSKETDYSETVQMAARKFQRRRDRDKKPTANLLQMLKKSREAAGLPLNPMKADIFRSDVDDDVKEQSEVSPPKDESPSENNDLDPVEEKANSVQDYVCIEPEWNELSTNEGSWQDNKSLLECNLYLLTHEIGCDVKLLVGVTQEEIQAHSYVLRSRSAKFEDILAEQNHLTSKLVYIPDVKRDTFSLLLRFLYTDKIDLTVDLATALIPASSAYGPTNLKMSCFYFLLSEMNSDNVCVTLEHAHTFCEKNAYDRCMNFIVVNAVDVLKSPNFENLCRECVEDIVKSDDLNAKEFVVFDALLVWASRRCLQKRIQPTDENKRKVLGEILFHVRFATMDVLEFTQKISQREILSRKEKISLYQFFHGETHRLPPQFNKSKRHEYTVNHKLVAKAFGKVKTKEYLPDVLSQTGYPVVPYKHTDDLPIKRVIRFQGVEKNWQMKGSDAIGFRVSKPIILRGCQMFGPSFGLNSYNIGSYNADNAERYNVDVVIYNDKQDIIRHEQKTVDCWKTIKVYDIILTTPVSVPPGKTFTIQLTIRGKPSYRGINGLEIVETDDVYFQFFNSNKSSNGTDTTTGQIPTILFSKL